jgi:hypothetical protein
MGIAAVLRGRFLHSAVSGRSQSDPSFRFHSSGSQQTPHHQSHQDLAQSLSNKTLIVDFIKSSLNPWETKFTSPVIEKRLNVTSYRNRDYPDLSNTRYTFQRIWRYSQTLRGFTATWNRHGTKI